MSEITLTPIEQKEIVFNDQTIIAVRVASGEVYVPIRPICESLGLAWNGQFERINRDAILLKKANSIGVSRTDGNRTRTLSMLALPLDYLNGWLFGINANRVKDSVREGLLAYQEDCYQVLADAFGRNQVTVRPDPTIEQMLSGNSPEAQAYQMAMAIANMARQQLLLRTEVETHGSQLAEQNQRIGMLEASLLSADTISNTQAQQVSEAVKAIAGKLGERSGRNEYGGVYAELYRRFGITSYKLLPANQFSEAIGFLRQWWQQITDESDIPF